MAEISVSMFDAIRSVHDVGVLHRDIKPDNFRVGKNAQNVYAIYLIDFGLRLDYADKDGNHIE